MRQTPLLPQGDAREAALFFVVSALCFLAALSALIAQGTYTAAAAWSAQVEGELSVIVQTPDRALAEDLADGIQQLNGVIEVNLLSDEEVEALLQPSLGSGVLAGSLALPLLIAVQADVLVGDPSPEITALMASMSIEGEVNAHSGYTAYVREALRLLRFVAMAAVTLLAATAIAVIAFATKAALLARRDIVDVLHLSGADDAYIAQLFEKRFWVLAVQAGIGGAVAALAASAAIVFFFAETDGIAAQLLPQPDLNRWNIAILLATPIVAGIVARSAARVTVISSLKEMM
ncbi:MAG: cell division protein FtsX [Henriciella sp.]